MRRNAHGERRRPGRGRKRRAERQLTVSGAGQRAKNRSSVSRGRRDAEVLQLAAIRRDDEQRLAAVASLDREDAAQRRLRCADRRRGRRSSRSESRARIPRGRPRRARAAPRNLAPSASIRTRRTLSLRGNGRIGARPRRIVRAAHDAPAVGEDRQADVRQVGVQELGRAPHASERRQPPLERSKSGRSRPGCRDLDRLPSAELDRLGRGAAFERRDTTARRRPGTPETIRRPRKGAASENLRPRRRARAAPGAGFAPTASRSASVMPTAATSAGRVGTTPAVSQVGPSPAGGSASS